MASWPNDDFAAILKLELAELGHDWLPLQSALRYASHVSDEAVSYSILSMNEVAADIVVKLGLFFKGVVAGCSCADDPSPDTETNEYCVVELKINNQTAEVELKILDDEF